VLNQNPNQDERLKRIEEMLENMEQQIDDMSERRLGNLEEELKAYLDLKLDELLGDITTRIELIPTFGDPTNEIDKQINALHSTIGELQRTMDGFLRGWIELLRRTGA
jgi:signal transduction protein with GAF and PtsI domain